MAAGVNVRSMGTFRDGGDVYAVSPQVDSGRDYFQSSPPSHCVCPFLVFLVV